MSGRRRLPDYLFSSSHDDVIANLARLMRLAEAEDWRQGLVWYKEARLFAKALGGAAGYTGEGALTVSAHVVACLSASMGWDNNQVAAVKVVDAFNAGVRAGDYRNPMFPFVARNTLFVDKALRVLADGPTSNALKGEKVEAFADNIINPLTSAAVTVDRHAAAACYRRSLTDDEMSLAVGAGRYGLLADAYKVVAAAFGVRPLEAQAIIWVVWRHRKAAGLEV
jgi:hypothetical protein